MRPLPLLAAAVCVAACGDPGPAPSITDPGVEGHRRYLPLVGTAHDPGADSRITCEGCHPGETFREPVCTGCHVEAATAAVHTRGGTGDLVPRYEWTPPPSRDVPWAAPSCLRCHPAGGVPDFLHEAYFPIGRGTPHDRACETCHADRLDKANLAKLRCVECHRGSGVKTPLPGSHATLLRPESYPAEPAAVDCLRCHARGKVDRIADHGVRPGPSGYGRAGPWDADPGASCSADDRACRHGKAGTAVNCFACHDAAPPLFGGKGAGIASRPWAQDWQLPAATAGQSAANACRGCHGPR